jgi:hypothetical protein
MGETACAQVEFQMKRVLVGSLYVCEVGVGVWDERKG